MRLLLYLSKAGAYSIQHVGCLSLLLIEVGGVVVVCWLAGLVFGSFVGNLLELLYLVFYVF